MPTPTLRRPEPSCGGQRKPASRSLAVWEGLRGFHGMSGGASLGSSSPFQLTSDPQKHLGGNAKLVTPIYSARDPTPLE